MVKYKGRLIFRQYMPDKPTKYGIKDFVLAEANTGFCLKVITYTGKHSFQRENCPLTTQVVLELLQGYEHLGHVVYMDNFYTSPELFMELQSRGIGACGTVRVNRRHMPLQLKPDRLKLKRGDNPVFMRADNLVALAWHDVKRVTCLSTVHTNNLCEKQIRSKGNPAGRKLDKPVALEEYNCKMAGVDRLDQILGTYAYGHKSTKWYHTVYHRLREIALTNGFLLFKQANSDSTMTAADFRKKVVDSLLEEYVGVPFAKRGRPAQRAVPDRLTERHFPATYEDKKYKPDCVVCSNRQLKKRHQCNTYCKQCNVAMHAIGCFERYHTLQDFAL
uniref:PiggyBac transposable element-derived protein domain-containing protein n=1 Tax=Erpetoichthys calabaricus TaxID=27687 RepID=A0A8C4T4J0_ERPCA